MRLPAGCDNFAMALALGLMLIMSFLGESHGFNLGLDGHGRGKPHGSSKGSSKGHGKKPYHGSPIGQRGDHQSPAGPSPTSSRPSGLKVGFYKVLCSVDVESLIATKVQEQFRKDPTILPALLRMQFHDCFVHGCDASILIAGTTTERNAGANLSVRGFEFIDAVKAALEAQCPEIVSCADIIVVATKVAIKLGGGPDYAVQTGRTDGLRSSASDVNLPSPSITAPQSISAFAMKGFTPEEMVVLLGAHTVGVAQCGFFEDRLRNGSSSFDPNMDPNLRKQLILTCTNSRNVANLDQNPRSSNIVDNSFYDQIKRNRGILPIDQALARDPLTSAMVQKFSLDANSFNTKFANAMIKLQALEVLTGNQGEVRKVCSKFN